MKLRKIIKDCMAGVLWALAAATIVTAFGLFFGVGVRYALPDLVMVSVIRKTDTAAIHRDNADLVRER